MRVLDTVSKERFARVPGQTERVIATWAFHADNWIPLHNLDHRDLVGSALEDMADAGADRVIFVPPDNPVVPPELFHREK